MLCEGKAGTGACSFVVYRGNRDRSATDDVRRRSMAAAAAAAAVAGRIVSPGAPASNGKNVPISLSAVCIASLKDYDCS